MVAECWIVSEWGARSFEIGWRLCDVGLLCVLCFVVCLSLCCLFWVCGVEN